MKVTVDARNGIVVPKVCPCCLTETARRERVSGSDWSPFSITEHTVELDFPSCEACLAHRKEGHTATVLTLVGGLALLGAGFALRELLGHRQGTFGYIAGEICAVLFVASLALAPVVFFWQRRRWAKNHPPHASAGRSVKVTPAGFGGNLEFKFSNEEYGRLFKQANAANIWPR